MYYDKKELCLLQEGQMICVSKMRRHFESLHYSDLNVYIYRSAECCHSKKHFKALTNYVDRSLQN